jgi:hypothetical protein
MRPSGSGATLELGDERVAAARIGDRRERREHRAPRLAVFHVRDEHGHRRRADVREEGGLERRPERPVAVEVGVERRERLGRAASPQRDERGQAHVALRIRGRRRERRDRARIAERTERARGELTDARIGVAQPRHQARGAERARQDHRVVRGQRLRVTRRDRGHDDVGRVRVTDGRERPCVGQRVRDLRVARELEEALLCRRRARAADAREGIGRGEADVVRARETGDERGHRAVVAELSDARDRLDARRVVEERVRDERAERGLRLRGRGSERRRELALLLGTRARAVDREARAAPDDEQEQEHADLGLERDLALHLRDEHGRAEHRRLERVAHAALLGLGRESGGQIGLVHEGLVRGSGRTTHAQSAHVRARARGGATRALCGRSRRDEGT